MSSKAMKRMIAGKQLRRDEHVDVMSGDIKRTKKKEKKKSKTPKLF